MIPESDTLARLVVRLPNAPRRDVTIATASLSIGRSPNCDVVLDLSYVSRVHARIERGGGGEWMLRDAGSTNGTFVNGRRLTGDHVLNSGDHISVADVSLTFLTSSATDATRTVPIPEDCPVRCDTTTREVWVNGEKITSKLSTQEFELLLLLSSQFRRVCPRDELAMAIWGEGNYEYNMLHRLVHRLKRKLGRHHGIVQSVAGVGYALALDAESP